MRRIIVPLLTYVALLPVGAGLYFLTAAEVATGRSAIAEVLFVTLVVSGVLGLSAMMGSYVIYFTGKSLENSNQWMMFGIDLLCQAAVVLLVVAALRR